MRGTVARALLTLVAVIGAFVWLWGEPGYACSCSMSPTSAPPTEEAVVEGSVVAFIGTAVRPDLPDNWDEDLVAQQSPVPYVFDVVRVDKGDVTDPYSILVGGLCGGGWFEPGVKYRVFGYRYKSPEIRVSVSCGWGFTHRIDQPPQYSPSATTPTLPGGLIDLPDGPVPPAGASLDAVLSTAADDGHRDPWSGAPGAAAAIALGIVTVGHAWRARRSAMRATRQRHA